MYEWLAPISNIFKSLLNVIHNVVPSYGWSIIILTIVFRAILLPLDIKQKVSMKKQALLQPKIAKINEKYKNDKEKAAQKTMELYKQEKSSPLSGCLPSLIQLPLFFAFFGALQIIAGSQLHDLFLTMQGLVTKFGTNPIPVDQLPHLESWLWVKNVWQPDIFDLKIIPMNALVIPPFSSVRAFSNFKGVTEQLYTSVMKPLIDNHSKFYNGLFILPLLAGASSYLQTKITMPPQPKTPDPAQQKNPFSSKTMQYIFPLMSIFFTASSNSIFALYWFTSNLCSVATFWTVDKIWAMNAHKREAAEKEKLQAATQIESAKAATPAITVEATDAKPAIKKGFSKEGKKK